MGGRRGRRIGGGAWLALLCLGVWAAPLAAAAAAPGDWIGGAEYLAGAGATLPPQPRGRAADTQPTPAIVSVGTELDFLVAGDAHLRAGTCRYVGDHCYIFVENAQWDTEGGPIYQAHVDDLGALFDRATPADPGRGVYALLTEAFGPPPDVDGHARIFIFVVEIADARVVGFFDPRVATWPDAGLRRDTIYLDAGMLRSRPYLTRGTLAHEFQHLVHFGADSDEEQWLNEGLSGYAEALAGFPETDTSMVPAFLDNPDVDLTYWPVVVSAANYGCTYLFVAYLGERFGVDFIRALVAEPRNGTFGVTAALQAAGHGLDFDAVWLDWILANYASTDSYWGYAALRGRRIRTYRAPALPFADIEGMVSRRWGTVGVVVRPTTGGRQNIRVDVAGDENGRLRVWGYAMRGAVGEAVYVPLDSRQVGQLVVPDVDSVAVLVGRTSPLGGSFRMSAASYEPSVVAVAAAAVVPERTVLLPAYPNPFNAGTVVPFGLAGTAHVELAVLNVLGQRVALLLAESLPAGVYRVAWDGRSDAGSAVGSGTYIVSLQAGGTSLARTVSVAR